MRVASLSPCFRGGVWGVKNCWNRFSSISALEQLHNSSFVWLSSRQYIFKNVRFKSLTGYTDYGGYVAKRDSAYTHIRDNDHIVAGRSVFVDG
jgi:hypothetical protein